MTAAPPVESPQSLASQEPPNLRSNWRLLWRGLEVRLRFFVGFALLAGIAAGWPWLQAGWQQVAARWQPVTSAAAVSQDQEFFCPMDPGVVSAWPAICPICNMDLIPRKKSDAMLLPEGVLARMQLTPYRVQLAGIRTVIVSATNGEMVVPESAIVAHGSDRYVYRESMAGQFDAVPVDLGKGTPTGYVVLKGLQPGQRVAFAGAFLVDAESRLNPNLATQYFGANAQVASSSPTLPQRKSASAAAALSAADQALIAAQKICPVTEAELGSMGKPVSVIVAGRKVFLCCQGCDRAILADPAPFLAKLPALPSTP